MFCPYCFTWKARNKCNGYHCNKCHKKKWLENKIIDKLALINRIENEKKEERKELNLFDLFSPLDPFIVNGVKLPLTIIKKGVRKGSASSQVVQEAVDQYDNYMGLTKSGWVSGESMVHWLRNVFAVNAVLPCALIMDGYRCHWTEEVRAAAAQLNIELISMPPNRTDEIQPLDVGVFGALQIMTDRDWETDYSVKDYLLKFQQAWEDFSSDNIRKAFYKALALEEGVLEDEEANRDARQSLIDEQNAINMIDNLRQQIMDIVPQ